MLSGAGLVGADGPTHAGSFDITYLASLPTGEIPAAFKDEGVRPVRGVVKKEVRAGADAFGTLRRSEFGMEQGIPFIGDEVRLRIQRQSMIPTRQPHDLRFEQHGKIREKFGLWHLVFGAHQDQSGLLHFARTDQRLILSRLDPRTQIIER